VQALTTVARGPHAEPVADAFGTTFWVALGLFAASMVPALLLPTPQRAHAATEARPVA
jgi:hypothetical protein